MILHAQVPAKGDPIMAGIPFVSCYSSMFSSNPFILKHNYSLGYALSNPRRCAPDEPLGQRKGLHDHCTPVCGHPSFIFFCLWLCLSCRWCVTWDSKDKDHTVRVGADGKHDLVFASCRHQLHPHDLAVQPASAALTCSVCDCDDGKLYFGCADGCSWQVCGECMTHARPMVRPPWDRPLGFK